MIVEILFFFTVEGMQHDLSLAEEVARKIWPIIIKSNTHIYVELADMIKGKLKAFGPAIKVKSEDVIPRSY